MVLPTSLGRSGASRAKVVLVLSVALSVLAVGLWALPGRSEQATGQERVIEVTAQRFRWEPGIIEVNRGDRVVLRVRDVDVTHGFYLDGYGIRTELLPGQEKEIRFTADRSGRFIFRCATTCGTFHPYMIGWLRVKPNTNFTAGVIGAAVLVIGAAVLFLTRKGRMAQDVHHV